MSLLFNRVSRPIFTSILNRSANYRCTTYKRFTSSNERPMMLMDLPRVVYPNLFFTIRNFFSRIIISQFFDSTFSIKTFTDGSRQALTVVSNLIANGQFDKLSEFVTTEVNNEVQRNYQHLSSQQKQKIAVDAADIVFSFPYLIGIIMDDKTNNRLVEITMIYHVLKDRESYRDNIFNSTMGNNSNLGESMKKMRENIVVCNYKFLRDMSQGAKDDSWIISGINHWLPREYEEQQQQQ